MEVLWYVGEIASAMLEIASDTVEGCSVYWEITSVPPEITGDNSLIKVTGYDTKAQSSTTVKLASLTGRNICFLTP